jgi:hypothetical protein
MSETLLKRVRRRHREMCFLAVVAYNIESNPAPWIASGLKRLSSLLRKLEEQEAVAAMKELFGTPDEAPDVLTRRLPDGRDLHLMPLMFGRGRLAVSAAGSVLLDDNW